MIKAAFALTLAALITVAAVTSAVSADKPDHAQRKLLEQREIRDAVARKELVPLPRILAIAQAKAPGEVIKVELERKDWGLQYEVKLLTPSGRVREVDLDARTGQVRKVEGD